jgi:hypothetical protein
MKEGVRIRRDERGAVHRRCLCQMVQSNVRLTAPNDRLGAQSFYGSSQTSRRGTIALMGRPPDDSDDEPTEPDAIERRLETVKERLREAKERLTTREHAVIDPKSRTDEDEIPTRPIIDITKKP